MDELESVEQMEVVIVTRSSDGTTVDYEGVDLDSAITMLWQSLIVLGAVGLGEDSEEGPDICNN